MPVQRPKEFKNYGKPNTLRGAVRCNLVYADFYNNAGQQQKRLLVERVQGNKIDYLELEGADRAMKMANPDLAKEVAKWIGQPMEPGQDEETVSSIEEKANSIEEVGEVGELHVHPMGAH